MVAGCKQQLQSQAAVNAAAQQQRYLERSPLYLTPAHSACMTVQRSQTPCSSLCRTHTLHQKPIHRRLNGVTPIHHNALGNLKAN